jgi:hypothetical protein
MMKCTKLVTLFTLCVTICFLPGSCENTSAQTDDNTIIAVCDLLFIKIQYKRWETFDTTNDELWVGYADGRWGLIKSGFTYEWAKEANSLYWLPIQHGDPLPDQSRFYVRGVCNGMRGKPSDRQVF